MRHSPTPISAGTPARPSPLLAGLLCAAGLAAASDGQLDPTFGDGGVAQTALGGGGSSPVVQADGKMLACFTSAYSPAGDWRQVGVVRFNTDGSLDAGFGAAGRTLIDFRGSTGFAESDDDCAGIALQPDGRIVVATSLWNGGWWEDAAFGHGVARLEANGMHDPTFGAGTGQVLLAAGGIVAGLAVQADGRIVLAGSGALFDNIGVSRLGADGSRDDTFGDNGSVVLDFGSVGATAHAIAIDADDRIVVAGSADTDSGARFGAARLLPDGRLDPGFGDLGQVTIDFGPSSLQREAYAIVLQDDGRIAMAGVMGDMPNWNTAIVRLLPDGSPDPAFGVAGKVILPFDLESNGWDSANSIASQRDGKLVIGGNATFANPDAQYQPHARAIVARLHRDGSIDQTFGESGLRVIAVSGMDTSLGGLVLQDSGIMAIGSNQTGLYAARFSIDLSLTNGCRVRASRPGDPTGTTPCAIVPVRTHRPRPRP